MPVRIRITCLFTLLVMIILGIVCVAIYYFSATARQDTAKLRLMNRAMTRARLLTNSAELDWGLVQRIDSVSLPPLRRKSIQAYNSDNELIYRYAEVQKDSIVVTPEILQQARANEILYFTGGDREAVAYADKGNGVVIISAAHDNEGLKNLQQLEAILVFCFISGTLLSFAGGWFFSKGLLQPVRKITDEVNEISAYNLDRRIYTNGTRDEWYRLSITLNQLLDRLKDSFELQRRFISNASHEMSTPLTLISTQLEISLQRNRSEEEYRMAMEQVLKDVQHMNNLVQTLLKFATTAGNTGGLPIDPVRIDEVMMRLPGEIQGRDKLHSVSLHFPQLPEQEERMLVFGNEELLFTALSNIVSNACKYSPDHHADVALTLEQDGFAISVADKGEGLDEKELARIFQPFYRANQSRNIKGFGLGLSLATQIIKLHKGTVKVSSVPGEGTTFTVHLPNVQIL